MTHPLTDQRSREDLIAELYDRHAAGLFAYCADQLGDPGSASDALDAVLSSVPSVEPPRAALYALARREIFRRDIVYAPPVIDPLIDPATALVERVLRDLRPHQREVLVLSIVIGLTDAELAWVLDVAKDTAVELIQNAALRFRQSLLSALAAAGPRPAQQVAEVYGALGVAPLRDVLGRLPWRPPPAAVRERLLGPRPAPASTVPVPRTGSLFVKPMWPTTPVWPVPLGDTDPATSTGLFPTELLTPPDSSRVPPHEAATAPMPKLRDTLTARPPLLSAPTPADVLEAPPTWDAFSKPTPAPDPSPAAAPRALAGGDILDDTWTAAPPLVEVADDPTDVPMRARDRSALADLLVHKGEPRKDATDRLAPRSETEKKPADLLVHQAEPKEPADLFVPRKPAKEPVYVLPPAPEEIAPLPVEEEASTAAAEPVRPAVPQAPDKPAAKKPASTKPASGRPTSKKPANGKPEAKKPASKKPASTKAAPKKAAAKKAASKKKGRRRTRHHDWAFELIGFVVCLAIAMLVFFWIPM
ncbi:hypothetical protein ACFSKW_31995 [Nonomuraea mangrovi]|uniref:DNA-directed RNA polymerase specialized sigma subunit, sigma24 family n=1 Tax=Nonomuraea mangrovi TaxID=2316207 RepID=A0ABW4T566_9ACTN